MRYFVLWHHFDYRELVTNAWSKKNCHDIAPNISQFFDNFNRTAYFLCWFVLCFSQPEERARGLEYLMEIAQHCLTIGNFSTFMQVMSAIEHTSISKLKKSWYYVSKHVSFVSIVLPAMIELYNNNRPNTSYKNSRRYHQLITSLRHYEMPPEGSATFKVAIYLIYILFTDILYLVSPIWV